MAQGESAVGMVEVSLSMYLWRGGILEKDVEEKRWSGSTVEVLKCGTSFPHEKWPRFGGSSKLIFLEQKPASCINWQWWCINVSASWPWQCWSSSRIRKINLGTLTRNFDYSHRFQKWWWLSCKTSNLSYMLARNRVVQESKSKKIVQPSRIELKLSS